MFAGSFILGLFPEIAARPPDWIMAPRG